MVFEKEEGMIFEIIEETSCRIPIPETYQDAMVLMQSDFYRVYGKRLSFMKMFIKSLKEPSLCYCFWLRLASVPSGGVVRLFCKWCRRRIAFKYGILIPSSTKIGYGLLIGHPYGIIVNHTAVIGNNVNLSQFTTIGSNEGRAAIIGDNVYIGPSCCLVEDVVLGSNSIVGAGSVVTRNVPENATVAGCPAKVLSYRQPGRYIKNRWEFSTHTTE